MNFTYKFEKLLDLQEREKEEAAIAYKKAVDQFEKVATKLYNLLKQKEILEEKQSKDLQAGLPIKEIRKYQQFFANLQKEIDYYQKSVLAARQKMQREQNKLLEKNIEVKKYEKLKERELEKFIEFMNDEDRKKMDEISMQITAREKMVSL